VALLLALDTSAGSTGAALASDGKVLAASVSTGTVRHSESLFRRIEAVLGEAKKDKKDISAVAVTHGPGSFTGLRVGLATAKGLAFGLSVKAVGVSSLRALALGAGEFDGVIAAVHDARKQQVYGALYDGKSFREVSPEGAFDPGDFAGKALGTGKRVLLTGSGAGAYLEVWRAVLGEKLALAPEEKWNIDPGVVALIGLADFEAGRGIDPSELRPVYHRLSEAEEKARKS
jgi:tRNA threonylcarbamoyladenosine biosynthesis protein TsaB